MSYTMEFIFTAIFMSLTVGGFIALCIVSTFMEDSKPVVKWIVGAILAIVIGCGISGLIVLQAKGDDETWNNGYCTECGNPYKFTSVVHHRNNDDEYYYTCDSCGNTIVVHSLYSGRN